jgi:aspartate aminotransferase
MHAIPHSATLALNEAIAARRAAGHDVLHLGFGEAGLPVLDEAAAALAAAAGHNAYGPVVGSARARQAVAGYFARRNLPTSPDQVLLGPGSKALLYAALAALPGDLVLPVPSWVSYAAQAALAGKRVIGVPIPDSAGGVPDPDRLEAALDQARRGGARPRLLILTLPDNPTGTAAHAELLSRVCAIAERNDLVILSDEIYRDLTFAPERHVSPAEIAPERTIVTAGLSKSMALGGWRIGFARLPDGAPGRELTAAMIGIASEVWSCLPGPMDAAAAFVLEEPPAVVRHVAASRRLHAAVSRAAHEVFVAAGASCRAPAGGFYLYPDFEPLRAPLAARGIATGAALADHLLEAYGVAVLAGEHFGDEPHRLRVRVATSLLYGAGDEERWAALRSPDPLALPWIAAALARLQSALAALAAGQSAARGALAGASAPVRTLAVDSAR